MGEAKRRGDFEKRKAEAESNIIRGVVIPPGKISIVGSQYYMHHSIRSEDLLYYAMYWDKIVMPSGIIEISNELTHQLAQNDVLAQIHTRSIPPNPSMINPDGSYGMEQHELYAFGEIAKKKLSERGSDWIIGHIEGDPIYLPTHRKQENLLRLRVTQSLPFPANTGEYSIDDLLNFKIRRAPELAALHDSMDNLIKKIHLEPINALKESEIKRFENAINELDKTMFERFHVIQKSDWEMNISMDIPTIIEKGPLLVGGFLADQVLTTDYLLTGITALSSFISLHKKYGFTFNKHARKDIKLEYISGAKSEKIIP